MYETAVELSDRAPLYLSALGHAYAAAEMLPQARQILQELEQSEDASAYHLAIAHLGLGNHAQAIDFLEQAYEGRSGHFLYLNQGPRFDPLRGNERFLRLTERIEW